MLFSINKLLLVEDILTDNFNRYDLVVNYITIDNIVNRKDNFLYYHKMHFNRTKHIHKNKDLTNYGIERGIEKLKYYVELFKCNEEQNISPILIGTNYKLGDGAHRLSCAIYFNRREINVDIMIGETNPYYGLQWFRENDFIEEEIEEIEEVKRKLTEKRWLIDG